MWCLLLVLGGVSALNNDHFLHIALHISEPVHQICLRFIQPPSEFRPLYEALACGNAIPRVDPRFSAIFTGGLAHLFVVSGAHLVLLGHWLIWLVRKGWISDKWRWPILTIFLLASSVNPPIFRAWLDAVLHSLSHRFELNLQKPQIVLMAGLGALAAFPSWWTSISLQLSWAATLSLLVAERFRLPSPFAVYLLLLPLVTHLQEIHPASILLNGVIGFLFAIGLFPLALLAAFIPGLSYFVDFGWALLLSGLQLVPSDLAYTPRLTGLDTFRVWIGILTLNWLLCLKPCEGPET